MGWFSGSNDDGSQMKVSDTGDTLKTERITSEQRPHEHEIVKVDKPSGTVKEFYIGENVPRKGDK